MRPLLQHASRLLNASPVPPVSSPSPHGLVVQGLRRAGLSICRPCQYRAASTSPWTNSRLHPHTYPSRTWSQRSFSSSTRWRVEDDGRRSSDSTRPMAMPPPTSNTQPVAQGRVEGRAPENIPSIEGQERLQEAADSEAQARPQVKPTPTGTTTTDHVADNITRVPDEHLPSHRERQRWDFSKRFSDFMDEVLPKLAVVTQKVNTYTGTDYSGVEALRREIKEQENLVKARRAAIDTAKHSLDTAHAQQASAQKEVVALLERKHSWSAGDLERYMSLIRSEHVNDQAIRLAKDNVISAEAALEEARTQLEKRERAQYHEEQIWSDTIRRNSTWVTFGLMGVNIFLLLLSLAILEPWRRRRMVREIKSALQAQKEAMDAAPASLAPAPAASTAQQDIAAIEEEIDLVTDAAEADVESIAPSIDAVVEESLAPATADVSSTNAIPQHTDTLEGVVDPILATTAPEALMESLSPATNDVADTMSKVPETWKEKVTTIAQDVISDRVISMRRIDYTTAILQGAAAGAVITAAIIGMLRPT